MLDTSKHEVAEIQSLKREGITITAIQEERSRKWLRSLRALGSQIPLQVAFGASPQLRKAINDYLKTGHFDVMHIEALRTLGASPDYIPIPTIWDEVDCMSQAYELATKFDIFRHHEFSCQCGLRNASSRAHPATYLETQA